MSSANCVILYALAIGDYSKLSDIDALSGQFSCGTSRHNLAEPVNL